MIVIYFLNYLNKDMNSIWNCVYQEWPEEKALLWMLGARHVYKDWLSLDCLVNVNIFLQKIGFTGWLYIGILYYVIAADSWKSYSSLFKLFCLKSCIRKYTWFFCIYMTFCIFLFTYYIMAVRERFWMHFYEAV